MTNESRSNSDISGLAEDASALIAATADVAGEKVREARERLADALESAKRAAGRVREKAVQGAKATDEAIREHPYQAIAIGVTIGAVIGYLLAKRSGRDRD
jgi:ElaB/YqjD/DUF883 family membrane-anchored ribosome-binding protein